MLLKLVWILVVLVVPLLAAILWGQQQLLLKTNNDDGPPPADFGSGHMFDKIATRYDFINRVLALRMDVAWRQHMSQQVRDRIQVQFEFEVDKKQNIHLLDVATGTADVALQLAKDFPQARIVGMDPSPQMLQVGQHKVDHVGLTDRIQLLVGDARDMLPLLEPNTFHAATMAFGIRNVPERDVALCQIHQLLQPNGILAILEFSEPDGSHGILGKLARLFIRHVVPLVGSLLSGAPREYIHLQHSIRNFPSPPVFRASLEELQCRSSGSADVSFAMETVQQLNFGSVQLYLGRAIKPDKEPATEESILQPEEPAV